MQCQKVDAWGELGVSLWFGGDGAAVGPRDLVLGVRVGYQCQGPSAAPRGPSPWPGAVSGLGLCSPVLQLPVPVPIPIPVGSGGCAVLQDSPWLCPLPAQCHGAGASARGVGRSHIDQLAPPQLRAIWGSAVSLGHGQGTVALAQDPRGAEAQAPARAGHRCASRRGCGGATMLCAGTLGTSSLAPQVQPVPQRCRAGCGCWCHSRAAAWGAGGGSTGAWPARHGGAGAAAPSSRDTFAGSRTPGCPAGAAPRLPEPPGCCCPEHGAALCPWVCGMCPCPYPALSSRCCSLA